MSFVAPAPPQSSKVVYRIVNIESFSEVINSAGMTTRTGPLPRDARMALGRVEQYFTRHPADPTLYGSAGGDELRFVRGEVWVAEATLSIDPIRPRSVIAVAEITALLRARLEPVDGGRFIAPSAEALMADITWRAIDWHRPAGWTLDQVSDGVRRAAAMSAEDALAVARQARTLRAA